MIAKTFRHYEQITYQNEKLWKLKVDLLCIADYIVQCTSRRLKMYFHGRQMFSHPFPLICYVRINEHFHSQVCVLCFASSQTNNFTKSMNGFIILVYKTADITIKPRGLNILSEMTKMYI